MKKWLVLAALVVAALGVVGVALAGRAGEGRDPMVRVIGPTPVTEVDVGMPVAKAVDEAVATATPWPTFTPVPTSTPTAVPPTPTPTRIWPTFTPVPTRTPTPAPTGAVEVVETRVPTPTPYGRYPGRELYFLQQSLFPLQVGEFPDYVTEGRWEELPRPYDVISRRANFITWVVLLDGAGLADDEVVNGYVRWMDVSPGWPELVMLENEVVLTKEQSVFYVALGNVQEGIWEEGLYRVVFLDGELNEVVSWEFEVR